jgi:hypothetical protein
MLLCVRIVSAHHSFAAEFDASKPVHLEGAIASVDWTNPHITIYMDVKNAGGNVSHWSIEAGSPNALSRRGLSKLRLAPGTRVLIDGYLAKTAKDRATGSSVTFSDGLRIVLDPRGP